MLSKFSLQIKFSRESVVLKYSPIQDRYLLEVVILFVLWSWNAKESFLYSLINKKHSYNRYIRKTQNISSCIFAQFYSFLNFKIFINNKVPVKAMSLDPKNNNCLHIHHDQYNSHPDDIEIIWMENNMSRDSEYQIWKRIMSKQTWYLKSYQCLHAL